ncbi:hypothetical protein HPB47_019773 [Ixodes persulcatus]|uniref:Uncharacterized protein n=1 Tax=Ixodes persulcatus TaxID=34615 RepID=A0AC60QH85_IXOPE|nr:hypothetical protein HPB47_019773 [Ixodes persulcatus]
MSLHAPRGYADGDTAQLHSNLRAPPLPRGRREGRRWPIARTDPPSRLASAGPRAFLEEVEGPLSWRGTSEGHLCYVFGTLSVPAVEAQAAVMKLARRTTASFRRNPLAASVYPKVRRLPATVHDNHPE